MSLWQLANRSREEPGPRRLHSASLLATRSPVSRLRSRIPWFDFMLGGGFARGAVVMIHGEPGAGKSTLLAQAAGGISGAAYISGEEDESQVAARFVRLGLDCDIMATDSMAAGLAEVGRAPLVIVDSIQSMRAEGALQATQLAVDHARAFRVAVAVVCQQNKEGQHAGLRALEHLTDCTIRLARHPRSITTEKNRYGQANISLLLDMTETGIVQVMK